jgi:hypothetical protein
VEQVPWVMLPLKLFVFDARLVVVTLSLFPEIVSL